MRSADFSASAGATEWRLDAGWLDRPTVSVRGSPSGRGLGLTFDGCGDGLFSENHPLARAQSFTVEALFQPHRGGLAEQRFVHLGCGVDDDRLLLELRAAKGGWYGDVFFKQGESEVVLADPARIHLWHAWYAMACVVQGRTCIAYINGVEQARAQLSRPVRPLAGGPLSMGQRLNGVWPFYGDIAALRFSPIARTGRDLWTGNVAHDLPVGP